MPSRDQFFAALGSLPHGRYARCRDLPRYRCKACRRTFMLTTGTPRARRRLPVPDWVVIAWMIVLGLSAGCASRETARSSDL